MIAWSTFTPTTPLEVSTSLEPLDNHPLSCFVPRKSDNLHRRDFVEETHQINFLLPELLTIQIDRLKLGRIYQ